MLAEYDVPVTLGSDAHSPDALRERAPLLGDWAADAPVETVELPL